MTQRTVLKSSKKIGKYESAIIEKLVPFFQSHGFQAVPHARLNVSWGNIISDIDVLLIKGSKVGIIEVKSSRDNLKRAKKQISNIKDYVDFAYIATDFRPRKLPTPLAGWVLVKDDVTIMKSPPSIRGRPAHYSVASLPKKCLERYSNQKNIPSRGIPKYEIAENILSLSDKNLRSEVKSMATCGQECDANCPIWEFEKLLVPRLLKSPGLV